MMEIPVSQQLLQMVQMVLCGWFIMFSSHEKQLLARTGQWSYRQRTAGDFLFCMFWAVGLWLMLLQVSGGMVRNYILLGLAGGMAGYQWLFRRRMERFCRFAANTTLFVWRWIKRILLWPCRFLWKLAAPWMKKTADFLREKQEFASPEENIIEKEKKFLS